MAKLGFFSDVISDAGVPILATITVYDAGTENKSSIWSDSGGTIIKDNPFQTDALGRFQFFASPGKYDIEVSGTGITTYKIGNMNLADVTKSTELTDMPGTLGVPNAGKAPIVKGDGLGYELGNPNAAAHVILGASHSDALAGTVILGDLIHGNATPAWARLAGQITTTRKFLRQVGTGAVSAVPAWDTLQAGDIPAHASSHNAEGTDVLSVLHLVSVTANINAKTVASTLLYTVPTGKTLIALLGSIRVVAFTAGSKTIQAVASFGQNASNYNDWIASATYTVTANNTYYRNAAAGFVPSLAAGAEMRINITTGSNATTETWEFTILGYLI